MAVSIPRVGRKSAGKAAKAYAVLQLVERAVTPTVKRAGPRTIVLVGGAGAAAGGATIYLLGSRRRRKETVQRTAAAEAREKVASADPKPDITDQDLANKVETIVFRDERVPKGQINIDAAGGTVVLRGEVPSAEMRDELVQQADAIPEVVRVENLLHLPGEPAPNWPSPEDARA
jgi:hypothetical protein